MTTTVLTDGRVIHIPGMPFILDSVSVIAAPPANELLPSSRLARLCIERALMTGEGVGSGVWP